MPPLTFDPIRRCGTGTGPNKTGTPFKEHTFMSEQNEQTRRNFLATGAKLAAAAGLVSTGGCSMADRGPILTAVAGPKPHKIDPNQKIRLGIIGPGNRIFWVMKQMFEVDKNITIKAIAEPVQANVDRALAEIKKQLGDTPDVYTGRQDYKTKLLARDDIDAVLVGTPCYLHAPMYLDCFAAGKHFYGEKPMAITVNETKAMVEAQRKNPDVIGQIGFQRRGTQMYPKGIEMVRSGVLGKLLDCRAAWNLRGPIGLPNDGHRSWFGRRQYSGDWMLEQACHTWDVLNWVAGKLPVAATGVGYGNLFPELDPDRNVTDLYFAHLEYPDFFVDYEHSWLCPWHDAYPQVAEGRFSGIFEKVCGKDGGISLNEGKIFYRDRDKKPEQFTKHETEPGWTQDSIGSFLQTLRGKKELVSGVTNGRMATLVGLMVRKAVYERRRVTMKEIIG